MFGGAVKQGKEKQHPRMLRIGELEGESEFPTPSERAFAQLSDPFPETEGKPLRSRPHRGGEQASASAAWPVPIRCICSDTCYTRTVTAYPAHVFDHPARARDDRRP